MNIHKDPWENFLYYDSKPLIDLIFRKGYNPTVENDYIALKFLLFIVERGIIINDMIDLVAHFNFEGRILGTKLFDFLR